MMEIKKLVQLKRKLLLNKVGDEKLNKKSKIFIGIYILLFIFFGMGMTYSVFHSNVNMNNSNQNIAKFIFDSKGFNKLEFPLVNLTPSDKLEYNFSVANNNEELSSDVTIEYKLSIETYHFAPLLIKLYDLNNNIIIDCNENSFSRNNDNKLICNSDIMTLSHNEKKTDNYKLVVEYEKGYDDVLYSDLVDYINVEISSWQKLS